MGFALRFNAGLDEQQQLDELIQAHKKAKSEGVK